MENETVKKVDLNEWFTDHKREICMAVGGLTIAWIFYRKGYKRGQDTVLDGLATLIMGGSEWTK